MGCSSSTPIVFTEILDKCVAPGVKFEEHLEDIEGHNRNIVSWFPEGKEPKAIVLISHGLNEHALCYYNVAIALVNAGYGVFAIDHASHGKSDGPRGVIQNHEDLYNDFIQFANTKRKLYSSLPAFVVAHSMGTLVALMSINKIEVCLTTSNSIQHLTSLSLLQNIKAIVFSGCAIVPGPDSASPFGIGCLYPLGEL
jgi:alpha-beta hydrolase superfamily lysophospholipase